MTWRVKTVLQGTGVTTAAVPNTGRKLAVVSGLELKHDALVAVRLCGIEG